MSEQPTGPSPEELQAMIAENILRELGPVAASFATHIPQDKLAIIAAEMAAEQMIIASQVIPAMIDPAIVSKQPELHIEIKYVRSGVGGTFPAVKRLELANNDPGKALAQALMFAFLTSPVQRALLRMHGYAYRFLDPKPKDEPRIKLVRG